MPCRCCCLLLLAVAQAATGGPLPATQWTRDPALLSLFAGGSFTREWMLGSWCCLPLPLPLVLPLVWPPLPSAARSCCTRRGATECTPCASSERPPKSAQVGRACRHWVASARLHPAAVGSPPTFQAALRLAVSPVGCQRNPNSRPNSRHALSDMPRLHRCTCMHATMSGRATRLLKNHAWAWDAELWGRG